MVHLKVLYSYKEKASLANVLQRTLMDPGVEAMDQPSREREGKEASGSQC